MASYNNDPLPVVSSSSNAQQQQKPGENDVILGIGCNKHCGNVKFRQFIKAYKRARFQTNPKIAAAEAVKEVVAFWRNLSPRGRFLAQSKTNGEWHEVEEKQAMRIASFFLLDQQAKGDLKRVKSGQAKKELQMKQQQQVSSSSILEPMPIGKRSMSSASGNGNNNSFAWQQKQQAPQHVQSFASLPSKPAQQSQSPLEDLWGDEDFSPLPLKFNDVDLDPLPTTYPNKGVGNISSTANYNSSNGSQDIYNPSKPQQQQQQQMYGSTPEQLQVSVNMVVNTMLHQGHNTGDNMNGGAMNGGVNTVTNIQIGTINDPSGMQQNQYAPNNVDYSSNNNFNNNNGNTGNYNYTTTDVATNANPSKFIQISTQSNNPNDYCSSNNSNLYGMQQQMGNPSCNAQSNNSAAAGYQMNDFQTGYFGGNESFSSINNGNTGNIAMNSNGGMMMPGNNAMAMNNMGMGMNMNMNGNNNMAMPNNNNMAMPNNAMSMNGNSNMAGNNNAMNQMNAFNATNNMMSGNVMMNGNGMNNMMNSNVNANGGQGWNKNKVANSVPCAADLLGSVFDDF